MPSIPSSLPSMVHPLAKRGLPHPAALCAHPPLIPLPWVQRRMWWRDTHLAPLSPQALAGWLRRGGGSGTEAEQPQQARALAAVGLVQAAMEPLWEEAQFQQVNCAPYGCDTGMNRLARVARKVLEQAGQQALAAWLKDGMKAVKRAGRRSPGVAAARGAAMATVLALFGHPWQVKHEIEASRERVRQFAPLYAAAAAAAGAVAGGVSSGLAGGGAQPERGAEEQQQQQQRVEQPQQQQQQQPAPAAQPTQAGGRGTAPQGTDAAPPQMPRGWRPIPFDYGMPGLGLPPTNNLPTAWWAVFPQVRRRREEEKEESILNEVLQELEADEREKREEDRVALATAFVKPHLRRLQQQQQATAEQQQQPSEQQQQQQRKEQRESSAQRHPQPIEHHQQQPPTQHASTLQEHQQGILRSRAATEGAWSAAAQAAAAAQHGRGGSGAPRLAQPTPLPPLAQTLSRAWARDREILAAAGVLEMCVYVWLLLGGCSGGWAWGRWTPAGVWVGGMLALGGQCIRVWDI